MDLYNELVPETRFQSSPPGRGIGQLRKRLTPLDKKDKMRKDALEEVHAFYSRQHHKKSNNFDEYRANKKMDEGELFAFAKDFKFRLPKSEVHAIFRRVSPTGTELEYQQFIETLLPLAIKSVECRTLECKNRLREIK